MSIQIICLHTSRTKDGDLAVHNFFVITLNHPATEAQLDLGHRFLLRALVNGGVEFILVGSGAEFLNGVPAHVGDVDIVHACNATNVERIVSVLEAIDALSRIQPERRLNLITRYGRLGLWRTLGSNPAYSYEDLLPHSIEMNIGDDLCIRVLNLETSIRIREKLAGERDRDAFPMLRWTQEEKRRRLRLRLGPERVMVWVQEE